MHTKSPFSSGAPIHSQPRAHTWQSTKVTQEHSMWLLNTARAELKFFPTPESVPGGYAILSHVWGEDEQTFQEVQAIRVQCIKDGTNPRDFVHHKVRDFCVFAERGGHQWGWADMCCIDKTSSTELSEAIVSMYRYYSLSEVCYAYLRDVPTASEDDLRAPESAFRKSRWHKRGWTLQELIAPPLVLFLSCTWEILEAKADLADLLEEITRVPAGVLRLDDGPSAHCVAARMSWAADRETTRPEDEAYCLMGIFGIFMPALYGEGRNAFLRLQEEIMRQVDDPSIFAWGRIYSVPMAGLDEDRALDVWARHDSDAMCGSFANSPSDFRLGYCMKHTARRPSPQSFWERFRPSSLPDLSKLPTFNITSYGIVAHLPMFQTQVNSLFVALLLGIEFVASGRYPSTRLCELVGDPWELAEKPGIKLEWRTTYILRSSTTTQSPASGLQMFTQTLHTPFHISHSHIISLFQQPDVTFWFLDPEHPTAASFRKHVTLNFHIRYPRQEYPLAISIYLGLCTKSTSTASSPQHWARIVGRSRFFSDLDVEHVCTEDHIDLQPRQTQSFIVDLDESSNSFKDSSRLKTRDPIALRIQVELSFRPHALKPTRVRTVHFNFQAVPLEDLSENGSTESVAPTIYNKISFEDAIVFVALSIAPFSCSADLTTTSRPQLLAVTAILNANLLCALQIDVGPT
ncbi:hypothetical protein GSI_10228 [Ganoderma sinense ZZ0214-1]|uniref:Uncharacterized protein n=1 Tax=Ganoderma sinense ZZ0214-1 TaxID=1077348 RepID=A0A2G8S0K6_9APHY|nr:hypothetical protein GSI_10228 [Ganoderma sinense ZZ0214-1]